MRKHLLAYFIATTSFFFTTILSAQIASAIQRPSAPFMDAQRAEFEKGEFEPKFPSESRWMDGGDRYTVLEPSPSNANASDIVAYETETGKRTVLVTAKQLIPAGTNDALSIDDYAWSTGSGQILIFTNAQKVWRRRTRGDYWILRLADGKLTKLANNVRLQVL